MTADASKRPAGIRHCSLRRRHAGLSLIELMVALTIGLVLLAGLSILLVNSSAARSEIDKSGRMIENGRYAMQLLSDAIHHAGYYGEVDDPGAVPASLPDPCSVVADDLQGAMPVSVQGYASDTLSCVPDADYKANTDILVIRRANTVSIAAGSEAAGTRYLQVSLCDSDTTTFFVGVGGDATFDLRRFSCDASSLAVLRRFIVQIYYIGVDDTLKRVELDGSAMSSPVALVDGIENMQVEYGIDTTGDGAPDSYTDTPADVTAWTNVMSVNVNLLARNPEVSPGYSDTKSYTLGSVTVGAANDGYKRHAYSASVRAINPSGRRE